MLSKMVMLSKILWYRCNPGEGQGPPWEVMDGGEEILLSGIRLYGMEVLPSKALDMSGSSYLTISYLLRNEIEGIEVIVP